MGTTTHAPTDRVTCPPDHKHQKTCYLEHKCRCEPCRTHASAQRERYRKLQAYGRPTTDLVDADPIREHVNMLRAAGLGQDRIAALSGIDRGIIRHLLYGTGKLGPGKRIRPQYAEALLSVLPDPKDGLLRDPRGTRRRLQALAVNGWSFARLARMLNMTATGIRSYMDSIAVTSTTHEKVAALFEELWNTKPPLTTSEDRQSVAQTMSWARRNQWVPALAWDDIDTDERPPQVHGVNRQLMTIREREAKVVELHRQRLSDHRIAVTLGIADRTVMRIRQRLGLPGWTKEQQEAAA